MKARKRGEGEASASPFPPGHFYSPIPDLDDLAVRRAEIWEGPDDLPGIDLNLDGQLELLPTFAKLCEEQPFAEGPTSGLRYRFDNGFFSFGDGLILYCMLRHLRPNRIVEVGSGWSSALTLDVNDRFLEGRMSCVFIEPHPGRLNELLRPSDRATVEVREEPVQKTDPRVFTSLTEGDILFIDSTHVAKTGSDVNILCHRILPTLPAGVAVHFHDIFHRFEYPEKWVFEGRAWNEAYLLRAYLTDNQRVQIAWFNDYLARTEPDLVAEAMPLWARNTGGSIWLLTRG